MPTKGWWEIEHDGIHAMTSRKAPSRRGKGHRSQEGNKFRQRIVTVNCYLLALFHFTIILEEEQQDTGAPDVSAEESGQLKGAEASENMALLHQWFSLTLQESTVLEKSAPNRGQAPSTSHSSFFKIYLFNFMCLVCIYVCAPPARCVCGGQKTVSYQMPWI